MADWLLCLFLKRDKGPSGWPFLNESVFVQMEKRGLQLPTVDYVRRKARKLEEMKNVSLKEEDVAKVRGQVS